MQASKPSDLPFDLTIELVDYDSALSPYKPVLPIFVFEHFEFLKANLFNASNENFYEKLLFRCDVLIDYSWEMLNTNLWVFVDDYWRLTYAYAMFYKIIYKYKQMSRTFSDEFNRELIKLCDLGLLMSGPLLEKQFDHIVRFIRRQSKLSKPKTNSKFNVVKPPPAPLTVKKAPKLNTKYLMKTEKNPSIEHFNEIYFSANKPVIIEGQMSHWPAMKKWRLVKGFLSFCLMVVKMFVDFILVFNI
jgi:hypothetical protein